MVIERVTAVTAELVEAFRRLIPQLTDGAPPPGADELKALLESRTSVVLIVRHPEAKSDIFGAGTLGVYRVPTGIRAVIEDVIVDRASRGLGMGEALMRQLLETARQMGARGVTLTSNPGRAAANRLYVRMGFALRQTNCYFYKFE